VVKPAPRESDGRPPGTAEPFWPVTRLLDLAGAGPTAPAPVCYDRRVTPFGISHDREDESPAAKARWFQSLSLTERMEFLCYVTDLALMANPGLAESEHAPQTAGRVRVVRAARG
jgi:hypothetical protein